MVTVALTNRVRSRASHACEYCHMPEAFVRLAFQIDHIIAEQHGGLTILSNLAWSCLPCNKRKEVRRTLIDEEEFDILE